MADIICPHCGKSFEMDRALKSQIESEAKEEIRKKLKEEFEKETQVEIEDLKRALKEKDEKEAEMRNQELKLREEKRRLENREKELTLETARQIDEERKKIEEMVSRQAAEEHRLKDLEKDKKIGDLMRMVEELRRKAQQGSQQLQGEVLELDLEETLRKAFTNDNIEPVGKGVKGADIKQIVKSPRGYLCGVILWESKRTKAWTDEWLSKLKDDLRAEKANIPVIVSSVMPKDLESGMGIKEGVWVCSYGLFLPLATLLRKNLLDVGFQKVISSHRGGKADLVYEYITGHEFRQQVEVLAELYKETEEQISKERAVFEKSWKAREAQSRRMILATTNIYGTMAGLVGSSMPQIKGLDLLELGEGKEST